MPSVPNKDPQSLTTAFGQAFNAGDIDALMALYEPGALLAPAPGQRVSSAAAIRAALLEYLKLKPRISIRNNYVMQVDNIALMQGQWEMSFVGPEGQTVHQAARSAEVARRQSDGNWLYLIDHPFSND